MTPERRIDERLPLVRQVRWTGRSGTHQAQLSNLSRYGCFIDSGEQTTVGDAVQVMIRLPLGQQLTLHGEVTHHQPQVGFGMRFIQLSSAEQTAIAQLIINAPTKKL